MIRAPSANGRLTVSFDPITRYWNGYPVAGSGLAVSSGPVAHFSQGIPRTASGHVAVTLGVGPAHHYAAGGLPFTADGHILMASTGVPTSYGRGLAFVNGAVAVEVPGGGGGVDFNGFTSGFDKGYA